MSTSSAKQPVVFDVDTDLPPVARAASLAIAVMKHCKAETYAGLAESEDKVLAKLELSDEHYGLLDDHQVMVSCLRLKPTITIAVCPACHGWVLVGSTAPSGCTTTLGCQGKPSKAPAAKKAKPDDG